MNAQPFDDESWMTAASPDGSIPGAFTDPTLDQGTLDYPQDYQEAAPEMAPTQPPQLPAATPPANVPPSASQAAYAAQAAAQQQRQLAAQRRMVPANGQAYFRPVTNPDVVNRGHMLGFATIALAAGALAGTRLGGTYGAIAGSLFAGAATNGYRALIHGMSKTPQGKKEAMISGTWAVVAVAAGGYLIYATRDKRASGGKIIGQEEESLAATPNLRRSCGIRAIV